MEAWAEPGKNEEAQAGIIRKMIPSFSFVIQKKILYLQTFCIEPH